MAVGGKTIRAVNLGAGADTFDITYLLIAVIIIVVAMLGYYLIVFVCLCEAQGLYPFPCHLGSGLLLVSGHVPDALNAIGVPVWDGSRRRITIFGGKVKTRPWPNM